jgi:hypothetical protein
VYPGADNERLKQYFNDRPKLAIGVFGGLTIMYIGLAIYGFSIGMTYLAVGAIIGVIAHAYETLRRWRNFQFDKKYS